MSDDHENFHDAKEDLSSSAFSIDETTEKVKKGNACNHDGAGDTTENYDERLIKSFGINIATEENKFEIIKSKLTNIPITNSKQEVIQHYLEILKIEIEDAKIFTEFSNLISPNANQRDVYKVCCLVLENIHLNVKMRHANEEKQVQISSFRDWMKYFNNYEIKNRKRIEHYQETIQRLRVENIELKEEAYFGINEECTDLLARLQAIEETNARTIQDNVALLNIASKLENNVQILTEDLESSHVSIESLRSMCNEHINTINEMVEIISDNENQIEHLKNELNRLEVECPESSEGLIPFSVRKSSNDDLSKLTTDELGLLTESNRDLMIENARLKDEILALSEQLRLSNNDSLSTISKTEGTCGLRKGCNLNDQKSLQKRKSVLQCVFCGENYTDFESLEKHVGVCAVRSDDEDSLNI